MTDHADTIRRFVDDQRRHSFWPDERDLAALTALLAERQQAIDALREAQERAKALPFADEPYEVAGEIEQIARAALLSLGEQP